MLTGIGITWKVVLYISVSFTGFQEKNLKIALDQLSNQMVFIYRKQRYYIDWQQNWLQTWGMFAYIFAIFSKFKIKSKKSKTIW